MKNHTTFVCRMELDTEWPSATLVSYHITPHHYTASQSKTGLELTKGILTVVLRTRRGVVRQMNWLRIVALHELNV
jgi:hypothetical protein